MKYAIIKDDLVVNIIVAGESFKPLKSMILINDNDTVCIGYSYNKKSKSFLEPEVKEDKTV